MINQSIKCDRCGSTLTYSESLKSSYSNEHKQLCDNCAIAWIKCWDKNGQPTAKAWNDLFKEFMNEKEYVTFT